MEHDFNLYWIDMKYIRNLQNKDKRVYSVSPQQGKQNRPYLGILVLIHGQKYCIPLSKVKNKYLNMKDHIDFSRIIVDDEVIAGLNFSRMIPVEIAQLSKADLKIRKRDNSEVKRRKEAYKKELNWYNTQIKHKCQEKIYFCLTVVSNLFIIINKSDGLNSFHIRPRIS